ncbi:MAG: bifunctional 5,10-methylenetetrahydrofolate dehydrogenase/5,10-methenyltetrahydrofolate cyclohydrolase [bacterium]
MLVLDGRPIAQKIREEITEKIEGLTKSPKLMIILTKGCEDAVVYTKSLMKQAEKVGILSGYIEVSSKEHLETVLTETNNLADVSGIIVQRPYPQGVDECFIQNIISPEKDIDGISYFNLGMLFSNRDGLYPATALSVIKLLEYYNYIFEGKRAVVVGRSLAVGRPTAILLLHRNSTVTICHSRTENIVEIIKEGDLVISAIGKKFFIRADMIKEGSWIVDCGFNYDETGGPYGDCDYESIRSICGAITPVPGGVGPITTTVLLENVLKAHLIIKRQ